MKVLVDNCVAASAATQLAGFGHEVTSVSEMPQDPGDEALLKAALRLGQIVVTLDRDFGELAVLHGARHSGIIRLVGVRAGVHGQAAHEAIERYSAELLRGAIVTVTAGRVRVRLLGFSEE